MSGFSANWLARREPVDHRARNPAIRDLVARALAACSCPKILDLGCGAGSNLRAFAPFLGERQSWLLVDHDGALLGAARVALARWADNARENGNDLIIEKAGKSIDVSFRQADLSRDVEALLDEDRDLVSAAALFDLASAPWIERFCRALAARDRPLYATLTYNGVERWTPPRADDAKMLHAFHVHQAGDKGFGPAAGPRAPAALRAAFERHGWNVTEGDSPWILGPADASLMTALSEGSAAAVAQTGLVAPDIIADWLAARRDASGCVVGHADLFAAPPRART